jgi:hypothetical protein
MNEAEFEAECEAECEAGCKAGCEAETLTSDKHLNTTFRKENYKNQ